MTYHVRYSRVVTTNVSEKLKRPIGMVAHSSDPLSGNGLV